MHGNEGPGGSRSPLLPPVSTGLVLPHPRETFGNTVRAFRVSQYSEQDQGYKISPNAQGCLAGQ